MIIHERTIQVPQGVSCRLDRFLVQEFSEHSRSQIQRWIKEGQILVNEKKKKSHTRIHGGDTVKIHIIQQIEAELIPEQIPLRILYEDTAIIAIDKPAGKVVHPASGHKKGTIVHALLAHAGEDNLSTGSEEGRPGIVHRLDKDTSGVLLIAKTNKAHAALAKALSKRQMKKEYLALVRGNARPTTCLIEAPIHRDPRNRKRMAVTTNARAKNARTRYETAETYKGVTLVKAFPETGRTHQIRVHFQSIGHPIIGDILYGDRAINRYYASHYSLTRQFLHAYRITFKHPTTKKELTIESPLPKELENVLKKLKRQ